MQKMLNMSFFLLIVLSGALLNPLFAADEQRQGYDQMVEEATREADEYVKQKEIEQHKAAEQRAKQARSGLDERVQAERKRLENEMNEIQRRGLGPNYTEGMRDNQLQEIQEKLNRLTSDPEAYFDQ